jgi:AraC-like DNA-binding protein
VRYQKYQPAAELRSFVKCYFIWEGEASERLEVQSPPNCFGAIVFNYGDPTWAYQNSEELSLVPDSFLCGLFTSNYHRVLKGKMGMAGIVFKPTAIHNSFGIRMSSLVNNRMPLELLLGDTAGVLLEKIKHGNSDETRIKVLEDFVAPRLADANKKLSIIDEALDYIDEKKGAIPVDAVAAHFKISQRYLEKQFLDKVGVSPKFYARMKRFTSLSIQVAYNQTIDWQDVVFKYGLHDQSHLVKEFMEFNKMSPSNYLLNHQEVARFVKSEK